MRSRRFGRRRAGSSACSTAARAPQAKAPPTPGWYLSDRRGRKPLAARTPRRRAVLVVALLLRLCDRATGEADLEVRRGRREVEHPLVAAARAQLELRLVLLSEGSIGLRVCLRLR